MPSHAGNAGVDAAGRTKPYPSVTYTPHPPRLPAQVIDAWQTLTDAGEQGAAAVSAAEQEAPNGEGPGGEVLAAVHAAMADDLNTPQVLADCATS